MNHTSDHNAPTCDYSTALVHKFTLRSGYEWASVSVEYLKRGSDGRQPFTLVVLSSYGNWVYTWSHPGDNPFRFLSKLDAGYMCGKLVGDDREFDLEGTVKSIRSLVLQERRNRVLTKERAEYEWDIAIALEGEDITFDWWLLDTCLSGECYQTRPGPRAQDFLCFYKLFWPALAEVFKESADEL